MGKRKMGSDLHHIKLETGTVYQTSKGGNYYFRYQVKGERKCVILACDSLRLHFSAGSVSDCSKIVHIFIL